MKTSRLSLLVLSALLSSASFAIAEPGTTPVADAPAKKETAKDAAGPKPEDFPVLQKIKDQAGKDANLEYDYIGKQDNIDVWLVSGDKIMQMVHVLPSGGAIIGGTLISPDGQELSGSLQKQFADEHHERAAQILQRVRDSIGKATAAKAPDASAAATSAASTAIKSETAAIAAPVAQQPVSGEMVWDSMSKLGVVHYGADKDAPVLYLIMDPTVEASRQAFKTVMPFADKKTLDLRVVPISLNSTDSIMQCALILARSNAAESLKALVNGTPVQSKEPPKPDGGLLLKNNATFVEALKLNVLPSVFYRKSATDPIRAVKGPPKDWAPVFKELGLQ